MEEEYGSAKVGYYVDENGKEIIHDTLKDRLDYETDKVQQQINDSNLLEYSGSSIKADNSYYGLQKDTVVEGMLLQNFIKKFNEISVVKVQKAGNNVVTGLNNPIVVGLKSDVVYTIIFKIKVNSGSLSSLYCEYACDGVWAGGMFYGINASTGVHNISRKFTLKDGKTNISAINFGTNHSEQQELDLVFSDFMILEGDYTNIDYDIPYFEGITSVGENELKDGFYEVGVESVGNNLFDVNSCSIVAIGGGEAYGNVTFENTSIIYDGMNVISSNNYGVQISNIKLPKNRNITLTYNFELLNGALQIENTTVRLYGIKDNNETIIKYATNSNMLTANTGYYDTYKINIYGGFGTGKFKLKFSHIQIEEVLSTPYTPYQQDKKTILSPIPLRSLPNETKDLWYLEEGKVEQKIGKGVLRGDIGVWNGTIHGDMFYFYTTYYDNIIKTNTNYESGISVNNKLKMLIDIVNSTEEGIRIGGGDNNTKVRLKVALSKLSTPDISGAKQWLNDNELLFYYELSTPIIHQVPKLQLKSFEEVTHVNSTNTLQGNITTKIPSNVQAVIQSQARTINTLTLENEALMNELVDTQLHFDEAISVQSDYIVDNDFRITMLELFN